LTSSKLTKKKKTNIIGKRKQIQIGKGKQFLIGKEKLNHFFLKENIILMENGKPNPYSKRKIKQTDVYTICISYLVH
jgi:hypothetical protein